MNRSSRSDTFRCRLFPRRKRIEVHVFLARQQGMFLRDARSTRYSVLSVLVLVCEGALKMTDMKMTDQIAGHENQDMK